MRTLKGKVWKGKMWACWIASMKCYVPRQNDQNLNPKPALFYGGPWWAAVETAEAVQVEVAIRPVRRPRKRSRGK